jgi:hypothetical protein
VRNPDHTYAGKVMAIGLASRERAMTARKHTSTITDDG